MAKSSARKTADAIHKIPEYYTGTEDPADDKTKMGDMWFKGEAVFAMPKKRKPLKRITDLRPKVKKLRSKKNGN